MYKIEKGIPLPILRKDSIELPLSEMKVGDSFLVPFDDLAFYKNPTKSLKSKVRRASEKIGMVLITYRERNRGFRIWRSK